MNNDIKSLEAFVVTCHERTLSEVIEEIQEDFEIDDMIRQNGEELTPENFEKYLNIKRSYESSMENV